MARLRRAGYGSVCGAALVALLSAASWGDDRPPGYEQLLPRGRIAAIDEPSYVDAQSAAIPPDAWVLGVVVEGRAYAYSVNLLNRHEVVNDKAGETAFAVVW